MLFLIRRRMWLFLLASTALVILAAPVGVLAAYSSQPIGYDDARRMLSTLCMSWEPTRPGRVLRIASTHPTHSLTFTTVVDRVCNYLHLQSK